jgi:Tol biopolymer transport system component
MTSRALPRPFALTLAVALAAGCADSSGPDDLDLSAIAFSYAADTALGTDLDIFVMPSDGSDVRRVASSSDSEIYPDWSPDGQTLLFTRVSRATQKASLWTIRADGTDLREVAPGSGESFGGRWSPDGQSIVFRTAAAPSTLAVMRADGTDRHTIASALVTDAYTVPSWSPDGRIAFSRYTDTGSQGIWTIRPDGTGLTRFTDHEDAEPRWSPDGTRLAYGTQVYAGTSALNILFVVKADGSDPQQISGGAADRSPAWSPDGKWIIFDRVIPQGSRPPCGMFRVPSVGGVAVNIQPARTRIACQGSAWRSRPAAH